jgi:hypothetical protein
VGRALPVLCLVVAPIIGFFAGSVVAQGPSSESDTLSSIMVGAGIPAALSFVAAHRLGRTTTRAASWAAAAIAATGVFWLVFVFLFFLTFTPV